MIKRTNLHLLSETRKQDRRAIIDILAEECNRHRIHTKVLEPFLGTPGTIAITIIAPGGLALTIDLQGKGNPQPNVHVLSWHFREFNNRRIIAPGFAQDINQHHRRKATDVCHGTEDLIRVMRVRLECIAAGRATKIE